MASCFVCKRTRNATNKDKGFSFYRFPKVENVHKKWMNFVELCGGEVPKFKADSVLCSAHFENDCFLQYVRTRTLKENATPTIVINRQKSAKKSVPEIAFNLTEKNELGVKTTEMPCSIPVIAKNLELEAGVCVLPEDSSFESSSNEPTSFSLNAVKPYIGSELLSDTGNIVHSDADDTPKRKYLKRMVSSLVNDNSQTKKKLKLLNQKIRRQKKRIISLKINISIL